MAGVGQRTLSTCRRGLTKSRSLRALNDVVLHELTYRRVQNDGAKR